MFCKCNSYGKKLFIQFIAFVQFVLQIYFRELSDDLYESIM